MADEKIMDYSQKEFADSLLARAVRSSASDIHFDSARNNLLVRFRIDGTLYIIETLPKNLESEIISRIKILSKLDVTEKRLPQDGHLEWEGYNVRVATFPTIFGESAVLRIFRSDMMFLELSGLGMAKSQLEVLDILIHNPYGILLITGPSNSGKTVLMYSILNKLNSPENNIITTEDPVELFMDGIRQLQVNESVGLTFAAAMRAILRQDPDIIMLGEIRDPETIQMATQAALSGRLVFSTFHTFDVPALVLRLREMGIPPSVIGHTLLGIVSRRLIKTVCTACKASVEPTAFEKKILGASVESLNLQRGKGCEVCHNTGYAGRTGIFEIVPFDKDFRAHIIAQKPLSELNLIIKEKNIETLQEAAFAKVREGVTTLEEVIRVVGRPIS